VTPFSELKVGDVVEVCCVIFPGGTEWLPAIIVVVYEHKIGARFMRSNSIGDYIALHHADRGKVWR
jgi:hypothetical protein